MQIDMNYVLEAYRDEIGKLTNENVLLRAQLKQLQNDLKKKEDEKEEENDN